MRQFLGQHFQIPDDTSVETLEQYGEYLAQLSHGLNWFIGDLVIFAERKLGPEHYHQVFPAWCSPGLADRCKAVAKAYPPETRNPLATWSIHMREANHVDRIQRVQAHVDAGRTSDEAKEASRVERKRDPHRWLLAIDVNYHLTRTWSSGAGVEAAKQVADWIGRTVDRLKEKRLTDVVCCMDSTTSFRKQITEGWEQPYKPRAKKDHEHAEQLLLVEELLHRTGFCCVKKEGYEADDLMASYAAQFDGRVTLFTCDKDMRQCLRTGVNMLTDVTWTLDDATAQNMAEYHWVTTNDHLKGCTYNGVDVAGISPELWPEFQTLVGDSTDGVSGAVGIGAKTAADLLKEFGSIEATIQAAKDEDERIKPAKRKALIEFEPLLEDTRKLVTLGDDLPVPENTRV